MTESSSGRWSIVDYAMRTQRSKTRKSGGVYKVFLQCDRAGQYLDRRRHPVDQLLALAPHKKRRRNGTQKTNCPFCVVVAESDGVWRVTVRESTHKHEPSGFCADQTAHRRTLIRRPFIQSAIRADMNSGVTAWETVRTLGRVDPGISLTQRDIYNARANMKRNERSS